MECLRLTASLTYAVASRQMEKSIRDLCAELRSSRLLSIRSFFFSDRQSHSFRLKCVGSEKHWNRKLDAIKWAKFNTAHSRPLVHDPHTAHKHLSTIISITKPRSLQLSPLQPPPTSVAIAAAITSHTIITAIRSIPCSPHRSTNHSHWHGVASPRSPPPR